MGKWVATFILLLHVCHFGKKAAANDDGNFFSNFLLEESVEEAQCDQVQLEVAAMDSATILDSFPRLNGKWVSQEHCNLEMDFCEYAGKINLSPYVGFLRSHCLIPIEYLLFSSKQSCEVRPGPEFLLRSYSFTKNDSFRLLQHYYEDESCILPLYTVVARGEMTPKEPSWVTPSGTEYEYVLSRVTVVPHTTETAENLSQEIKDKCTGRVNKSWKPHREYIIYNLKNSRQFLDRHRRRKQYGRYKRKKSQRDIDCLSLLGIEFNELMLIRTQTRSLEEGKKNRELLLGDIHSRSDARFTYKPTAFQVPLLKSDQAHDCVNCQLISKGTERAPPHLLSKPQLPPLPHGQWVSQRCEVRSFGMFLTRKLSFDSRDRSWTGEYKFHTDPFCTESAFAISASGTYVLGPVQSKPKIIRKKKTGVNFDFKIEDASITLFDPTLRDTFNTETNCGIGPWFVGVPKELSPTSGCSILGIVLPTTEYELIKLEIDNKGTPLLFMGLPDTENKKRSHKERPTSYQAPLAQCSVFPQQNVISNHLEPIFYARTALRSTASSQSWLLCYIIGIITALCCFIREISLISSNFQ